MNTNRIHRRTIAQAAAALLFIASAAASSAADLTARESARLTAPLSRDDPRAQLDASYDAVPEATIPPPRATARRPRRSDARLVLFDLETRRAELAPRVAGRPPDGAQALDAEGLEPTLEGFAGSLPADSAAEETLHDGIESPHKIYGPDNRARISPTTGYPARTRVKLWTNFGGCSGTLIGPRHVITNGHCVYKDGEWPTEIRAVPGLDGNYQPFGSAAGRAVGVPRGWTLDEKIDYDYALVELDRDIGETTGWVGMRAYLGVFLGSSIVTIAGYPGDMGGTFQYGMSGYLEQIEERLLRYTIDANEGQSGSGITLTDGGRTYLVGVHRGWRDSEVLWWGSDTNVGPRITAARFDEIRGWMSSRSTTYESNRDRWGSDYRGFELATPDYRSCRTACLRESRCAAWSYVKPGVQGVRARCWLKSSVPQASASSNNISGVKYSVEPGFDYAGGDYRSIVLAASATPTTCRDHCMAEVPRCRAWTYVHAGFQGATPRCWLKDHVNAVQNLTGTTTGLVGSH